MTAFYFRQHFHFTLPFSVLAIPVALGHLIFLFSGFCILFTMRKFSPTARNLKKITWEKENKKHI